MHKSATKCNETVGKWCKNKHGASKIIDTLETYQAAPAAPCWAQGVVADCLQLGLAFPEPFWREVVLMRLITRKLRHASNKKNQTHA
jgi:hypothetical protein